MNTIRNIESTASTGRLHPAFELGWTEWKLAFTIGQAQPPRLRTIAARVLDRLAREIAITKERFHLPADASVVSCYEAGRDGFWLHRYLTAGGIGNIVVDSGVDLSGADEIAEMHGANFTVKRGINNIRLGITAVRARLETGRLAAASNKPRSGSVPTPVNPRSLSPNSMGSAGPDGAR